MISFKLGSTKSLYVLAALFMLAICILFYFTKLIPPVKATSLMNIINSLHYMLPILAVGITSILTFASFLVSTNIFAKKEF